MDCDKQRRKKSCSLCFFNGYAYIIYTIMHDSNHLPWYAKGFFHNANIKVVYCIILNDLYFPMHFCFIIP